LNLKVIRELTSDYEWSILESFLTSPSPRDDTAVAVCCAMGARDLLHRIR
jgi:hypothetical protein